MVSLPRVAVIGVGRTRGGVGRGIFDNIRDAGFTPARRRQDYSVITPAPATAAA